MPALAARFSLGYGQGTDLFSGNVHEKSFYAEAE